MKGLLVFCLLIFSCQADESYEDILWAVRSGFVEYERQIEQTFIRMGPIEFSAADQMIKSTMDLLADTIDMALDLGGMVSDLVSVIDENNGTISTTCLIPVGTESLSLVGDSVGTLLSCEKDLLAELMKGEEPYLNATKQIGSAQAFAYETFESCVRFGVYNIDNLQNCFENGLVNVSSKVAPIKKEIRENMGGLTHLKKDFDTCMSGFKTNITDRVDTIVQKFTDCEEKKQ